MTQKEHLEEAYYCFEEQLGRFHPETIRAKLKYDYYCMGWQDCEKESTKQLEQVNKEWQKNMELQKKILTKIAYKLCAV